VPDELSGVPSNVTAILLPGLKLLPLSVMVLPTGPALGFRLMAGVTMKIAEAEFALPSDAVTVWVPAVATGLVNAQELKLPVTSVVQGVATLLPSKDKVMGLYAAKPLPLTTSLLPSGPALAVRLMAGSTVKVALPEYVPSDAVTVWGPASTTGTVNAQLLLAGRLPLSCVVQVPDVLSGVPSKVTVTLLSALKLLPLSVTVLSPAPSVGFRLMAGLTVKVALLEFVLASDAVTAWVPAAASGTVNVQELKLPVASVVQDVATLLPSKVKVMGLFGAKPRPLTAALLPTAPALGVRPMGGLIV
jgi:hypothetical protein